MAIFLSVLKIIGIVLLVIIGIILAIILYLLFAPFWFRVTGDFSEGVQKTKVMAKISSFLHLFSFSFTWDMDNGSDFSLYIINPALKLYPRDKSKNNNITDDKDESDNIDNLEPLEDHEPIQSEIKNTQDIENSQVPEDELKSSKKKSNKPTFKTRFIAFKNKLKSFNPRKFFADFKNKFNKLRNNLTDPRNKACLKKCLSALKKFIKSLGLNTKGTDISFGIGDPETTGYITAFLSFIPITYNRGTSINPDFNCQDPYVDGQVAIRGRILLVSVVYFILSIYLDRDARRIFDLLGGNK